MNIDLTGKKILVTGASRGIGKAIAKALLESGAFVGIHYGRNKTEAAKLSNVYKNSVLLKADLSSQSEVINLFDSFHKEANGIDVLVNNAGIAIKTPMETSNHDWIQQWNATMDVNINHLALLCKLAIETFQKLGGGRIINISSRAALRGDTPDYLAYAASKGAVMSLTRSIARGFGKEGIMAFDIAPGFTKTDMAQDFIDEYGEAYAINDLALNRMTAPDDIAPIVVLLASGKADHATGSTIHINAGSYVH